MNDGIVVIVLAAAVAYGTPLLFAALGELLAERSGVLNLGVEGMMLLVVLGSQTIGFGLVGEIIIFTQARNLREYRIEKVYE
jgi:ABC-type uncharacterized transport system permease subunit